MDTVVFAILLVACLSMRPVASGGAFSVDTRRNLKPCEDFYEYACDKWKRRAVENKLATPTQLKQGTTIAEIQVAKYLQKKVKEADIHPVKWAKNHFQACKNKNALNQIGVRPLVSIVNQVSDFGWKLLEGSPNNDWVAVHNSYCRLTGKGALFTVDVGPDENFERNVLMISPTEELFLRKISTSNQGDIRKYEKFLTHIWTAYNKEQGQSTLPSSAVQDAIQNVMRFRQGIIEKRNEIQRAPSMTVMRLSGLQEHTRRDMEEKDLDWQRLLQSTFRNVRNFTFNESTVVHIRQFNYLTTILRAIDSAPVEVLLNHINFHFLERFIQHTSSDMNARFYQVLKRPLPERSITCISSNAMKKIVNFIYVKEFLGNYTIYTAAEIARNVRETLGNEIWRTNWIERDTARIAMLKLDAIREEFGYDIWHDYQINMIVHYYSRMTISKNYFRNILDFETMSYRDALQKLWRPVGEGFNKQLTDMFDVNAVAAYNYKTNTLVIPPAVVQHIALASEGELLYYPGNYGAFGTIVGYSLSHSLDSLGRQYDENGNRRNWWGNKTLNEYNERLQCFLERSKQAILRDELNLNLTQVDGNDYSDEMVAEYMGLAATRKAYWRVLAKFGTRKLRWFHADYDQTFFTAYAMRQCEVLSGTNAHLLRRLRVNTALSNMQAFADAFRCKASDSMNPSKKCQWLNEANI